MDSAIDRAVAKAKMESTDNRWRSFEAAVTGKIKEDYFDEAVKVQKKIESAGLKTEIPEEDVISSEDLFRKPLEKGIERKKVEIDTTLEAQFLGEISEADTEREIDQIERKINRLPGGISEDNMGRVIDSLTERRQLVEETPILDALRAADTPQDVVAIEIPETLAAASQRRLKQIKGRRLSEERVEDIVSIGGREIWSAADQLTGQLLEEVESARGIGDLDIIDINAVPTKKGQRLIRSAVRAKRREFV